MNKFFMASAATIAAGLFTTTAEAGRVFYVDFQAGNDSASGLSPEQAWRRSPGDALATGKPLATVLQPGDTVRFKGGVRYRGTIAPKTSGTADNPIIFDGSGWGSTRAVFDGSDAMPAPQPCPSQEACLDAVNWKSLQYVSIPASKQWYDWAFSDDQPYMVGQYPSIGDSFDYDNVNKYAVIPLAQLSALQAGRINVAGLPAGLSLGDPKLVLWSQPNVLNFASSFAIGASGIDFTATGFKPYTNRDNRFSIMNTARMLTRPGTFALAPSRGIAVFYPHRAGATLSIGARRNAFLLSRGSNITIRGFVFANYAGDPSNNRSGVPILNTSSVSGITVAQNVFRGVVLTNGMGAVTLNWVPRTTVSGNSMTQSPFSSGFRIANTEGPVDVSCNSISKVGRTGIYLQNVMYGRIRGNHLSDINGIHGNAISAYLDNRQIEIADNVVANSVRPLTLKGAGGKPYFSSGPAQSIAVLRNSFTTNDLKSSAYTSWGDGLTGVTMANNLLAGPKMAMRTNGGDGMLVLTSNQIIGTIVSSGGTAPMTSTSNLMLSPTGNGATLLAASNDAAVAAGVCSAS